jgi:hypothetical protein
MRQNRIRQLATGAALVVAAVLVIVPTWAQRVALARKMVSAAPTGPKLLPLVNADEEMASYLRRAQEMIEKQE